MHVINFKLKLMLFTSCGKQYGPNTVAKYGVNITWNALQVVE